MTEVERISRAQRARAAMDEFIAPMLSELRDAYSERLVLVANDELNRDKRADKITALSHAIKIVSTLENGMAAIIMDGDIARKEAVRAEKIEGMTAPQRRLLQIGSGY